MTGKVKRKVGGIMPLELPKGREYYAGNGVLPVNCGRAAIYYALLDARPKHLYLPLYLCSATEEPAKRLGIPYSYYDLTRDFLPVLDETGRDEAVLWVNYYGVMPEAVINEVSRRYPLLILDNTHAFFYPPRDGVYNIYSCRKFFGVADGGYLVKSGLVHPRLDPDTSYQRLAHRLKCIDLGEDAVYDEYVQNELGIAQQYTGMSRLTKRLMQSIDYETVQKRRYRNYRYLFEQFGRLGGLQVDDHPVSPMAFVMLASDGGSCSGLDGLSHGELDCSFVDRIRKRGVMAVNWWRHVMLSAGPGSFEHLLADRLVQVPIDQRYDESDMAFVKDVIIEELSVL